MKKKIEKLHPKVIEILQDRADIIDQFSGEDAEEFAADRPLLLEAIRTSVLNDTSEDVLMDYASRDGYSDSAEGYIRAINCDLALAGRLEVDDGMSVFAGGKPKTCQVNGVKYFAAV